MGRRPSLHSSDMTNRTSFTVLSFVAFVACGGQVTSLGSVGEPEENRAATDSSESNQPSGTGSSSGTGGTGGGAVDAGSADGSSGGGGSGKACNPFVTSPSSQCVSGEYCQADVPGTCGIGRCVTNPPPPPPFCPSMECGCDGKIRCADGSRSSGVDVGTTQCGFACGNTTCDGLTQYCEHAVGGIALPDGGASEWWQCHPIPTACSTNRSCACITQAISGGTAYVCESEKDQKVTVMAPLP